MELFYASTADTLTLWWEQPEDAPAGQEYSLRLNGQQAYLGDRTHCTLRELPGNTAFRAALSNCGKAARFCSTRSSMPEYRS